MMMSAGFAFVLEKLREVFVSPGSDFSLASLICALCIAVLVIGWRRRGRRHVRAKVLLRSIFPKRLLASPSTRADIGFFFFNSFLAGTLFGWAVLSYHVVSRSTNAGLIATFGTVHPTALPVIVTSALITVALFVAYEFGYWLDHYLSHRIPLLWEFHKVHHTSEVLSPLTNFRVHPIDGIVFYNVLALIMGGTEGALNYSFGQQTPQFVISSSNAIVVIFTYLLAHLHHTNFWIAFTGIWGRLLISPAHHQIHHSTNPIHFNKNMGSCLALWDWLFGTLHVPSKRREKLIFGVEPRIGDPHSVTGTLIAPLGHALALLGSRATLQTTDRSAAAP